MNAEVNSRIFMDLPLDFTLSFSRENNKNENQSELLHFNTCVDFFTCNSCVDLSHFFGSVPLVAYGTMMEPNF